MLAAKQKLIIWWQPVSVTSFLPKDGKIKVKVTLRVLSVQTVAIPSDFSLGITQLSEFPHNGHVTY